MANIRHSIEISAPLDRIDALISSAGGLAAWWAADVTTADSGAIELGFFDRSTTYRLFPHRESDGVRWNCETGEEWAGTSIVFRLHASGEQTLLLFSHEAWAAETAYFVSCNTVWGHLMFRLKEAAERGGTRPLFTKSGMDRSL